MLPAGARLRRSADFTATLRASRATRADGMLVLHAALPPASAVRGVRTGVGSPPQVGFVVPRAVGPAVRRNLVRRRLRHLMRDRLTTLPAGSRLVVRVLPPAAAASYPALSAALDRALERALRSPRRGPVAS